MPLIKSKSKEAIGKNIAAEIKAGKPPKQAAAIAYSVQRDAKKMKDGGEMRRATLLARLQVSNVGIVQGGKQ
jgi:hypothetical protein